MVQRRMWLVWIVWRLEWTWTWQLGGTIRDALQGEWFCQKCAALETGAVRAADLEPGENVYLGKDAGMHGQRGAYTRWHQATGEGARAAPEELNGPKNTAKHIEAKQNWINRETKRIEAEVGKVAEVQGNIRARKETLGVACEEIKKLRADLVQEGESMNKNGCHVLSPESLEEERNIELQELYLRRATASKRMAGARRDPTVEEIANLSKEAERTALGISGEKEGKSKRRPRKNPPRATSRCQTRAWTDWMDPCHHEGANVDIASNIRVGKCC